MAGISSRSAMTASGKIDPVTGRVLATIPAPGGGGDSGLAWAEGTLWVGEYRERKIHQIDPETGAILRTITSDRFVTGVSWVDGTLWHGAGEGDQARCVVSTRQPVKCWNRSTCHPA
jgi:streptogramin lyase